MITLFHNALAIGLSSFASNSSSEKTPKQMPLNHRLPKQWAREANPGKNLEPSHQQDAICKTIFSDPSCQTARMKPRSRFGLIFAVTVLTGSGLAHQPWFNPGSPTRTQAYPIQQPNISKVITAEAKGGRDWYSLEVNAGFKLEVALFVGATCAKDFKPHLYLIGPGLEGVAPFELPTGNGALQVENTWSDYNDHGVIARRSPTLLRTLTAGRYDLVVDHGNARGWYFISLAGAETPGGSGEGRSALSRFNRCA
jgi:hypothetical protein